MSIYYTIFENHAMNAFKIETVDADQLHVYNNNNNQLSRHGVPVIDAAILLLPPGEP